MTDLDAHDAHEARDSYDAPTIVVAVDGSPASLQALRWAVEEARLRDSKLVAVHAWRYLPDATSAGFGAAGTPPEKLREDFERQARRAERCLEEAVSQLEAPTALEQRTVEGHAPEVLVDASRGAELLVVGSRGHGTVASALLGSVSQACTHHAACPVVVIRDGSSGEQGRPWDPEAVIARERAQNERTWEALSRLGVHEGAELVLEFCYQSAGPTADRILADYLRRSHGYRVEIEAQGVTGCTPPMPVGRAELDDWMSTMVMAGHEHGGCAFDGWTVTLTRRGASSPEAAALPRERG